MNQPPESDLEKTPSSGGGLLRVLLVILLLGLVLVWTGRFALRDFSDETFRIESIGEAIEQVARDLESESLAAGPALEKVNALMGQLTETPVRWNPKLKDYYLEKASALRDSLEKERPPVPVDPP